jgi:DNA primase
MFPIQDLQGRVVGFTARLLDPEAKEAKYVNTPQTDIYNKSEVLYGLDKAKRAVQEADLAVVVEGNMDVITSHRVGVKNVIASSGTALTEAQVNIIKRYSQNIAFAFDADSAGQVAAKRGIDMALSQAMNVGVIVMGEAKDPDELINRDPSLWQKAIDGRVGAMEYYFNIAKNDFDLTTAEGKNMASKMLIKEIVKMANRVEQAHWLQELSRLVNVSEQVLRESLPGKKMKSAEEEDVKKEESLPAPSREELAEQKIISILINRPNLIPSIEQSFQAEFFTNHNYQQLYKSLILFYNSARLVESGEQDNIYRKLEEFVKKELIDESDQEQFYTLALAGERDWQDMDNESLKKELLAICRFSEDLYRKRKKQQLAKAMEEAEKAGNQDKVQEILKQYKQFE